MSELNALDRLRTYRDQVLSRGEQESVRGDYARMLRDVSEALFYAVQTEAAPPAPVFEFNEAAIIKDGRDLYVLRDALTTVEHTYAGGTLPELEAMRLRVEEAIVQLAVGPPEQPQA